MSAPCVPRLKTLCRFFSSLPSLVLILASPEFPAVTGYALFIHSSSLELYLCSCARVTPWASVMDPPNTATSIGCPSRRGRDTASLNRSVLPIHARERSRLSWVRPRVRLALTRSNSASHLSAREEAPPPRRRPVTELALYPPPPRRPREFGTRGEPPGRASATPLGSSGAGSLLSASLEATMPPAQSAPRIDRASERDAMVNKAAVAALIRLLEDLDDVPGVRHTRRGFLPH
mmetsp:Transcript_57735/g.172308  ORF Transcript_57735/g.172308 Transcript_57735/m.172308 type:complete len:233 (+) Transcript_57735:1482-2180(+)